MTTLLLGSLGTGPAGLDVRIAGGGHPAALLVTAAGTVTGIPVGGMPVGALAAARFAETRVHLDPGDLLLAVHRWGDRGARPRDAAAFGEARLRAVLVAAAGQPPAALIDRVLRAVDDWLDGQAHDDIAMLAVGVPPPV
ncbi:PP2C family protein-serine/threonine phosphatase [Micromonospora tarensis]|uniref:PP2C family protein-serine/threonine phosphatase n=1 Tax=Micromonospora tarensis TaxID=2806100 RepID=UPI001EE4D71A|nr:SpoIIE family protein phosphatase [Micromonospora tarensis]